MTMERLQRIRSPFLITTSLFALVALLSFGLIFSSRAYAEYDCGTYSSGNYNSEDYQAACGTTAPAGTNSNDSNSATNSETSPSSNSSTSGGLILPVQEPVVVTQDEVVMLDDFARYENGDGQHLIVTQGQRLLFTLKGQQYSITIKEITADYMIVTISSALADLTIQRTSLAEYDADKDGSNDISIAYTDLQGDQAEIEVHKVITQSLVTPASTAIDENADVPSKNAPTYLLWLLPLVITIIIAVILLIKARRRHSQRA